MNKTNKVDDSSSENKKQDKKTCFIMMPIAEHTEYPIGHFKRVYDYLIKPACEMADLEPYRADDNKASDMIMVDILQKLVECDMAICDISSRNANVFFELGLRQAFNKKTILITDGTQVPPFDISGLRNVPYSKELRVDTVNAEVHKIAEMLIETEKLSDDKVNSVVKLLQIKPAKVESKELGQIDSVVFNMFTDLKKQIAELKPQNTSRGWSIETSDTVKNQLLSGKNFFKSNGIFIAPKGSSFNDIYERVDKFGIIADWAIESDDENDAPELMYLGKFIEKGNELLTFGLDGEITTIANTPNNRKKIISI